HHFGRLKPDQATLAGLTCEIGILPILTMAEETPELFENEELLDNIIDRFHPQIGSAILRNWDFPEELASVPEAFLDFGRDSTDGPDYGDLVTVANLQSRIGTNHPLTQMDWSEIPAFDKLGMSHEVDVNEAEEFQGHVAEAKLMLV
ncbi:MAG TPA: HDOD domain-containing protein, partial [Aeromonadales bacterium]|nr:HDOD domain-containing protein [Aeromonadales bacterium]